MRRTTTATYRASAQLGELFSQLDGAGGVSGCPERRPAKTKKSPAKLDGQPVVVCYPFRASKLNGFGSSMVGVFAVANSL